MKFRRVIFSFVLSAMHISHLFSVQETITRGQEVYDNVMHYIRSQKSPEAKCRIIDNLSSNIINAGFYKADNSRPDIKEGLADISPVIALVAAPLANAFLTMALKRKPHVIKMVKKGLLEDFCLQEYSAPPADLSDEGFKPEQVYSWVKEKQEYKDSEGDQVKMEELFDIICFSMHLAREQKDLFKDVIGAVSHPFGGIVKQFSGLIHKKLESVIPELEDQEHEKMFDITLTEKRRQQEVLCAGEKVDFLKKVWIISAQEQKAIRSGKKDIAAPSCLLLPPRIQKRATQIIDKKSCTVM